MSSTIVEMEICEEAERIRLKNAGVPSAQAMLGMAESKGPEITLRLEMMLEEDARKNGLRL